MRKFIFVLDFDDRQYVAEKLNIRLRGYRSSEQRLAYISRGVTFGEMQRDSYRLPAKVESYIQEVD